MNVISRQETQALYPNIFKRGVVALIVFSKRGRLYQVGQRADQSLTKPVLVPEWFGI